MTQYTISYELLLTILQLTCRIIAYDGQALFSWRAIMIWALKKRVERGWKEGGGWGVRGGVLRVSGPFIGNWHAEVFRIWFYFREEIQIESLTFFTPRSKTFWILKTWFFWYLYSNVRPFTFYWSTIHLKVTRVHDKKQLLPQRSHTKLCDVTNSVVSLSLRI